MHRFAVDRRTGRAIPSNQTHYRRPPSEDDDDDVSGEQPNTKHETAENKKMNVRRLLAQARPELCLLVLASICLFISAGFLLIIPKFFGDIIDAIGHGNTSQSKSEKKDLLNRSAIGLAAANVLAGIFG